MSLLKKALSIPDRRLRTLGDIPAEELELIEAYLANRIGVSQGAKVLGLPNSGNFNTWVGYRVVRAIRSGKYKLVRVTK